MLVKANQVVRRIALVSDPETGVGDVDADSTPTGTLYRNGVASAESVTVSRISQGRYLFSFTVPSDATLDEEMTLVAAATIDGDSYTASDEYTVTTKTVPDLQDLSQANIRTAVGLAAANLDEQLSAIAGYIDAEVAAIKAKTDNLPADPASESNVTSVGATATAVETILTGITSLAAWLRAMARKDAADATAKSEINTEGGTYNEATDSQEAIRDRGDAAWVTGEAAQGGSYTITTTVTTTDGVPIQNAIVKVYAGDLLIDKAESNVSGIAYPTADAGTYRVTVSKPGLYRSSTTASLVVDGNELLSVQLTAIAVSQPDNPDCATGYILCLDDDNEALTTANVVEFTTWMDSGPGTDGYSPRRKERQFTNDATGLAQYTAYLKGATYAIRKGTSAEVIAFTVPTDEDTFELPEVLGEP